MMTEVKKSLKLLKYTYQFRLNVVLGILFFGLGIFWVIVNGPDGLYLATIYWYLGPIILVQLIFNLLYAGQVASSMQRKSLERTAPDIIGLVTGLLSYVGAIIYMMLYSKLYPSDELRAGAILVEVALVMVVTTIYCAIAYKWFVISIILFTICFALTHALGMAFLVYSDVEISLLKGSLIGLAMVVAANLLAALIRKAIYKYPYSPLAAGRSLRKAMV